MYGRCSSKKIRLALNLFHWCACFFLFYLNGILFMINLLLRKKKLNYTSCYLESLKERITEPNVEYKTCFVLSKTKIIFPKFFFFFQLTDQPVPFITTNTISNFQPAPL